MPTEADTCRTYVIPKLKSAGWEALASSFHFGDGSQSALLQSVLRPQGGAFMGELW
jgi:hypothetical protein